LAAVGGGRRTLPPAASEETRAAKRCRPRSITRHNYRPENGFARRIAENDNVFGIFARPARPAAVGHAAPRRLALLF